MRHRHQVRGEAIGAGSIAVSAECVTRVRRGDFLGNEEISLVDGGFLAVGLNNASGAPNRGQVIVVIGR
jgi:hypothetical protein